MQEVCTRHDLPSKFKSGGQRQCSRGSSDRGCTVVEAHVTASPRGLECLLASPACNPLVEASRSDGPSLEQGQNQQQYEHENKASPRISNNIDLRIGQWPLPYSQVDVVADSGACFILMFILLLILALF